MAAERTLYRRRCGSDRREDSFISAPCVSPGGIACAGHMVQWLGIPLCSERRESTMIDTNHLCPGCMGAWEDTTLPCPRCGFAWEALPESGRELEPFSILGGKYLLGVKIGAGGFGITYIAMDLEREETVAVKEFFPVSLAERVGDQVVPLSGEEGLPFRTACKGFRREAALLARLAGIEGIVPYRDFLEENGTAYLVMDYIEGINVKQYMRQSGSVFSEDDALSKMRPILAAVEQMHRKGILHRDISPENLILQPDGRLVLLDFGAAREFRQAQEGNLTVILKHGYAPEEQYHSDSRQGPWTDVYACCAVLYQMISGIQPPDAVARAREDRLEPLDRIPGLKVSYRTAAVLHKGLSLDPADRYGTVAELAAMLYAGGPAREGQAEGPGEGKASAGGSSVPPDREEQGVRKENGAGKKKWWVPAILAGTAAVAAAVFLLPKGSTEQEKFPAPGSAVEVYGNLLEDGSLWMLTDEIRYDAGSQEEEAWGIDMQSQLDWTFSAEEIQLRRDYDYEGGDSYWTVDQMDAYGRILTSESGAYREEYEREDGWVIRREYEDGVLVRQTETEQDSQGRTVWSHTEWYRADGTVAGEEDRTSEYQDHGDGSYTEERREEAWETGTDEGTGEEAREEGTVTSTYQYDEEGRILSYQFEEAWQSSQGESSGRNYACQYVYGEDGDRLSQEVWDESWYQDADGTRSEDASHRRSAYTYEYDGDGNLLCRQEEEERTEGGGETLLNHYNIFYTYDESGNVLTEYHATMNEAGKWEGTVFYAFTYAEFILEDGVYTPTGRTSGTREPELPEMAEEGAGSTDSPAEEQASGTGEEPASDVRWSLDGWPEAVLDDTEYAALAECLGAVGFALAPQEEDYGMSSFEAGLFDGILVELTWQQLESGAYPTDFAYAFPPERWASGETVAAILCQNVESAWKVTQTLYEEEFYEFTGTWAQTCRGLASGKSGLVFTEPDAWKWPLMGPILQYVAETQGNAYSLADGSGTVQQEFP